MKEMGAVPMPRHAATGTVRKAAGKRRLPGQLSAPLHDYPLREEILFQYSGVDALIGEPSSRPRIFEAGPGAGFAAHCLAGRTELTLADAAAVPLAALARRFAAAGVKTWHTDLGSQDGVVPPALVGRFDMAFGLDMFQYVAAPELCLRRMAELLRPGGELFLTYPNQATPQIGHLCWFERGEDLAALLRAAGFAREEIFEVNMRSWARAVYAMGHEAPLALLRRARRSPTGDARLYDQTWAFRQSQLPVSARLTVHAWWSALQRFMALGGPRFAARPLAGPALGRRLVVRAWKGRPAAQGSA